MKDTESLIAELSRESAPRREARSASYWALRLFAVLGLYAATTQAAIGLRPDLIAQLLRPWYLLEITLLAALAVSSAAAAILAMYPDACQKQGWLRVPYALLAALVAVLAVQFYLPADSRMLTAALPYEEIECALTIAGLAALPSVLLFALIRKGATVQPLQAGMLAALAAAAVGCLTLRLAEPMDLIAHIALWHYLPTLLFALAGALAGKRLFRW